MRLDASRRAACRAVGVACIVLLLGACATRGPTAANTDGSQWAGRFSLTVHSDPPQSWTAGFELSGSATAGELLLSTPLGSQLASVRWSADGAELQQGERTTRHRSLDSLTRELGAGSPLPVAALFDWLRGQPASVTGWEADLSRQPEGRIVARRLLPLPGAELRLVFQP
jgi:outer membrane lipoprotein LolB